MPKLTLTFDPVTENQKGPSSHHPQLSCEVSKTECLLLGPLKGQFEKLHDIKVVKHAIKCLGIYIGHNKEECYVNNWMKIYHQIEKLFESWKRRKLTIFGKCCIINSLAISKLIYKASILPIPSEEYIKKITRLICNFVWEKTERIKRNTIIGRIEEGGIGLVDIETKLKALKAAWVSIIMVCYVDIYNMYVQEILLILTFYSKQQRGT